MKKVPQKTNHRPLWMISYHCYTLSKNEDEAAPLTHNRDPTLCHISKVGADRDFVSLTGAVHTGKTGHGWALVSTIQWILFRHPAHQHTCQHLSEIMDVTVWGRQASVSTIIMNCAHALTQTSKFNTEMIIHQSWWWLYALVSTIHEYSVTVLHIHTCIKTKEWNDVININVRGGDGLAESKQWVLCGQASSLTVKRLSSKPEMDGS